MSIRNFIIYNKSTAIDAQMNAPRLPPLTCICEGRGSSTNRDQEPVAEGQKNTAVFLEFTHQEQKGSFHMAFILVF